MTTMDDWDLLQEYALRHSEEAFAALVSRHINLVYSVAFRYLGNPQQAEETTQAVFIILAKKAGRLRRQKTLSGWLYQTARFAAANHRRTEIRRARREQESFMQSLSNEPESASWMQIAPLLDEAIAGLGDKDRHTIVMRFFEGRELRDMAAALGSSETAAKMRLSRAVDKLRQFFVQRGVALSSAALMATLAANAVQAAPIGLAAAATASALHGTAVTASTLTTVTGALKIMAWTKAKTAGATALALLLTAGVTTVVVENISASNKKTKLAQIAPAIDQIRAINPDAAMAQAKSLIFSSFVLKQVPEAAHWCETLNANGKLWPATPTNTVFALNAQVAGHPISTLPEDTVVYFETAEPGWNRVGGAELLPSREAGVVVAFANGRVLQVNSGDSASLRWLP